MRVLGDVIDLSSSPEPVHRYPISKPIELNDSDDEHHATQSRRRDNNKPVDAVSGYVAQVLEVIPDVDPPHLEGLVRQQLLNAPENVLESVLHILFEDPTYPKSDKKGKRKRVEEDDNPRNKPKAKIDYASQDRPYNGGVHYPQLAIEQLMADFPLIPKPYLRQTLLAHHSLYAPTHIFLKSLRDGELPYTPKTIPSRPAKGKQKALQDAEFTLEREWVVSWGENPRTASVPIPEEDEACDDGLECGCCFSDYAFEKMIQCPDGHLFCAPCMTQYAETLLGSHDIRIVCMDQSGCKLLFPIDQLRRFLTPKLLELYERVKQNKEVAAAGLEGLEECPFCEFKCVIENEQEKLFNCRNDDCGAVTCRQCKQLDHLPKSCKEVEEDKKREGRHHIEEAMTRALMRNCPRCQKAFVKDAGCNKMICPGCNAMSCYVCRKLITGYEHFASMPGQPVAAGSSKSGRCPLWDTVEQRHADEVKAAADQAREAYKRDNPDADDQDLQVDLPVAPPPLPQPQLQPMAHQPYLANPFLVNLQNANALYQEQIQRLLGVHQARMPIPAFHLPPAPAFHLPPAPHVPVAPPRRPRAARGRRR
ncbi:hypothetical protein MIND_01023100 [Mycena indigotica]|uniref:RING-type domain-containing protein n=1 Tax=Mycena indigotica TaxID=2126181 RepID=A0A8H6SAP5_9AGAR|nr:uncharacterized protein MIND_01023100 [Mycena indigotica]KAF7294852.1 hypothetical protein MIND_01023100 [Mycena indigotica]